MSTAALILAVVVAVAALALSFRQSRDVRTLREQVETERRV